MSEPSGTGDNLYDTLGVGADASEDEIASAYRRRARERHPDTNPTGRREAFAELTDAYDVLRDPDRRRAYDAARRGRARAASDAAAGVRIPVRHTGRGSANRSTPGPSRTRPTAPGARHEVPLPLTFEQAALGTTAIISYDTDLPCAACGGSGASGGGDAVCAGCGGTGHTDRHSGGIRIRTECPSCGGTGRAQPVACTDCDGSGVRQHPAEVRLRVPPGVDTGTKLRVTTPQGDDIVGVVAVDPHQYFTRTGDDLRLRVPVTIAEAALGAVITVPTLDSAVAIRLPAGTPHGRTLRVKGRGVPRAERRGDLLVTVDVIIPTELNETQRAALAAFASATESPRQHLETPVAGDRAQGA
jgi:molecular chaperone DnaJ